MSNLKIIAAILISVSLSACVAKLPSKDYSAFYKSDPHSILIVPVINHSEEAEAADLFLTTLPVPLAEKGYYVFPTNMVKQIMDKDGLSDAHLVHSAETVRVASLFGADSVLYVEILEWDSKYNVLSAGVQVHFLYTIKDGKTGRILWQDEEKTYVGRNSGGGIAGLIATAIGAAIDSASSDYTYVANQANALAIMPEQVGVPFGPYSPAYTKGRSKYPASGSGYISDATTLAVSYPQNPNPVKEDVVVEEETKK